jgi:uncharacterized protein YndB with AHSA1/START domain
VAYEISATIEIAATPDEVWAVLSDLASYPQWHPAFRKVSGQLAGEQAHHHDRPAGRTAYDRQGQGADR